MTSPACYTTATDADTRVVLPRDPGKATEHRRPEHFIFARRSGYTGEEALQERAVELQPEHPVEKLPTGRSVRATDASSTGWVKCYPPDDDRSLPDTLHPAAAIPTFAVSPVSVESRLTLL